MLIIHYAKSVIITTIVCSDINIVPKRIITTELILRALTDTSSVRPKRSNSVSEFIWALQISRVTLREVLSSSSQCKMKVLPEEENRSPLSGSKYLPRTANGYDI